jgi:hypothetical protein
MGNDHRDPMAMDGYITRSDGANRPTSQIKTRPAPPAPMNPKPVVTAKPVKTTKK